MGEKLGLLLGEKNMTKTKQKKKKNSFALENCRSAVKDLDVRSWLSLAVVGPSYGVRLTLML